MAQHTAPSFVTRKSQLKISRHFVPNIKRPIFFMHFLLFSAKFSCATNKSILILIYIRIGHNMNATLNCIHYNEWDEQIYNLGVLHLRNLLAILSTVKFSCATNKSILILIYIRIGHNMNATLNCIHYNEWDEQI